MSDKKAELKRDGTMQISSKEGESAEAGKMDEPLSKKQKIMTSDEKSTAKRISTIIRTAKEGEELLKDMGHKDDNPDSDRRRTRSQTRGVPPPPPLAPRKVKNATIKPDGTKSRGRGRPKKGEKKEEILIEVAKEESSAKKDTATDETKEDIKENKRDENGAKKLDNDKSGSQTQNPISSSSTEKAGQDN